MPQGIPKKPEGFLGNFINPPEKIWKYLFSWRKL